MLTVVVDVGRVDIAIVDGVVGVIVGFVVVGGAVVCIDGVVDEVFCESGGVVILVAR